MSSFLDIPQFCLNLKRRPDRRLRAVSQFRRVGLQVEMIPAPDAISTTQTRGWKSTGLRACALAHRLGWRSAWRIGAAAAIIFEDDVILSSDFKPRLEALELPEDWQICYFGCVFHQPPTQLGNGIVKIHGTTWDAHGYIIRKDFARFLDREYAKVSRANFRPSSARQFANDTIMADFHGQFPAYGVWPPMAWQVEGLSNNENCVRGNYLPDGRQRYLTEIIHDLPWPTDKLTVKNSSEQA
jgi:GR25 family glycosyltransferase involved in LPS biosynthesis